MPVTTWTFKNELEALQRWVKQAAGLNSLRLSQAPPMIARPVILWETPARGKNRSLNVYSYTNTVSWYGRLYVVSLDQFLELQQKLEQSLEASNNLLPLQDDTGTQVSWLRDVDLYFYSNSVLDIALRVSYTAAYQRTTLELPPAASVVGTRIITNGIPEEGDLNG